MTAVVSTTAAVVVAGTGSGWAQAPGVRAYGITADGTLMATFTTDKPQVLDWVRSVTGLTGDKTLLGIDTRVQDGLMYGLGNAGGIYSIKTPPTTPDVVFTKVSQLSVPLEGRNFGVDFNPAADRLRVVSDTGQNLRHNLSDHSTVEDAVLSTPPADGPTRGVTAAAYTNNDLNPDTGTQLDVISPASDELIIQSPANKGLLAPLGKLGVDADGSVGFEIHTDLVNGKATALTGFATFAPKGGNATLYTVNLVNGAVTPVGQFPLAIADITTALDTD
ncbi:hypothetical protein GCM10010185_44160 [Saccharothrix coeruleofusca]|uniref:DUF4394 domain-containing protein n=1 Tax=Saccharothrix coeruleofusca TaxID=33919 RepID=A0A918EEK6_9PSEU|nr:hypothetical protein GCM10010185_44160 [Saccharothrix coeruleofusca]